MILSRNAALAAAFTLLALAPAASAQKGGSDLSAPAQITVIKDPVVGFREVTLVAAVTGDDLNTGRATATELRFRLATDCPVVAGGVYKDATGADCFSDNNWAGIPNGKSFTSPPLPGVLAAFRIPWTDGLLLPGKAYLFALRMVDDVGKRSPVSPIVPVTMRNATAMTPWSTTSSVIGPNPASPTPRAALAFGGDEHGHPAIAYAPDQYEVRFSRFDGTAWTAPVPIEPVTTRVLGWNVEMVNRGGSLGVAYGGQPTLKYREFTTGGGWGQAETIVTLKNDQMTLRSLVATSYGPVATYVRSGGTGINIARRVNNTWVTAAFMPGASTTMYGYALAADPSDLLGRRLGLAYSTKTTVTGGTDHRLYFVVSNDGGATWGTPELVDEAKSRAATTTSLGGESTGSGVALAFDNAGVPHVKYSGGFEGLRQVFVARKGVNGWAEEAIGYGDSGGVEGIVFGASGRLYAPFEQEDVDLAASRSWGSAETWTNRVLLAPSPIQFSSYSLGPNGPAAAYFATVGSAKELRYALMDPASAPGTAASQASGNAERLTVGEEAGPLALLPAYPNPSSGRTTLRFRLPEAGRAEMVVYDLLGREVARPASGDMEAGSHAVTLDASELVAGTYVVRLRAGGNVQTRTLTVAR